MDIRWVVALFADALGLFIGVAVAVVVLAVALFWGRLHQLLALSTTREALPLTLGALTLLVRHLASRPLVARRAAHPVATVAPTAAVVVGSALLAVDQTHPTLRVSWLYLDASVGAAAFALVLALLLTLHAAVAVLPAMATLIAARVKSVALLV